MRAQAATASEKAFRGRAFRNLQRARYRREAALFSADFNDAIMARRTSASDAVLISVSL